MFGGGKGKSGFGGFASKFASDALKGAKQAGAAAAEAASKASKAAAQAASTTGSTTSLPQMGLTSAVNSSMPSPSTNSRPQSAMAGGGMFDQTSPYTSMTSLVAPPGLEGLSEEEQMKIMAVMQCAELDMAAADTTPAKISVSKTMEIIGKETSNLATVKAASSINLSAQPNFVSELTNTSKRQSTEDVFGQGLGELSIEEQEQILRVMRMAEEQDDPGFANSVAQFVPPTKEVVENEAVIIHEQLNDKNGSKTRKLSLERNTMLSTLPEQLQGQATTSKTEQPSHSSPPIEQKANVESSPQLRSLLLNKNWKKRKKKLK
uniref:Uncharacterized protein n=1 Tax=Ditylenchus dipsaci TaxID=166011 RepID=A0A915CSC2_9BILA